MEWGVASVKTGAQSPGIPSKMWGAAKKTLGGTRSLTDAVCVRNRFSAKAVKVGGEGGGATPSIPWL